MAFNAVINDNLDCTGYTGEYLRMLLCNGDVTATCLLTNAGVPLKIYLFVDTEGNPVPQPGVPIFIKAAADLDGPTTAPFFEIQLTQYNPGIVINADPELNEYWAGEISVAQMNLLPTGEKVYFSLERGVVRKRDDALCLYVKGGI